MSLNISGLGQNGGVPSVKSTGAGVSADFSGILQKSSEKYGVDLDALFNSASEKYGVPVNLLKAVAKAESGFNPKATSPAGAMGIMQLMPGTATGLGVTDAYDPAQNIMGGAKYLSQLLSRFGGDTTLAVAAYNAGPGAVSKYGGVPPYNETQSYVRRVMGYLGQDITAGTVPVTSASPALSQLSGLAGNDNLGAILEGTLLSGGFGSGDMTGLLSAINGSDPKDITNALMASVYQLQLQMLQGGDDDDNSVIV
ncbi:Transglycosylase SLT domain-containing protein [Sporobacter termitidis DSM 10068]|uniref:Transglycosylase SLT domain-containing protein n=1 Tax=Sporobacter termitidis DSM 10068 TaxID=1123282 RepID=A0A1M5U7F9_9FIRM|nr:lytic transglycosylase domain-containing protein [Sporobacter termitidis]SHH58831.1 Transglycosylase SLT domain-containing protein [Sporobacter termitidis DSM 10068]